MEEGKNIVVKTEGYETSEASLKYIYKYAIVSTVGSLRFLFQLQENE